VGLAVSAFASSAGAQELSLPSVKVEIESLGKFDNPWAFAYLPGVGLLITEKPGNLRIYADGKLSEPVAGVPKVEYRDQGCLLDVAVDPGFAKNDLIYLSYTEAAEQQPADASEEKDPRLGDDIWSLGHRNPLGAAFRPGTSELWVHEMGPKDGHELNLIEKGKNYGSPQVSEGKHHNNVDIPNHSEKPEFRKPDYAWVPAISPAGLIFYTGDQFQAWKGKALLGGLSFEALIVVTLDGSKVATRSSSWGSASAKWRKRRTARCSSSPTATTRNCCASRPKARRKPARDKRRPLDYISPGGA
jgi:glucose/arabinose dehydrogenase